MFKFYEVECDSAQGSNNPIELRAESEGVKI